MHFPRIPIYRKFQLARHQKPSPKALDDFVQKGCLTLVNSKMPCGLVNPGYTIPAYLFA